MAKDLAVWEVLEKARIDLLLNHPFFGVQASKLEYIQCSFVSTLATDGKRFYYNPDFVRKLTHAKRVFGVAHEIGHCIYDHFAVRKEDRDPQYWNMAGDYVINYDLVNEEVVDSKGSITKGIGEIDPDWLYEEKYGQMTAEQIYDDLLKNKAEKKDTMDEHMQAGEPGEGQPGEGQPQKHPSEAEDGVLDGYPKISEEEMEKNITEFQQEAIKTAEMMDPGNVPGRFRKIISDLKDPKKNWKELLRSTIESAFKSETDWMTPHRRSWSQGYVMPGMVPDQSIDIAVAVDTSGSMGYDQLRDILSEIAGIMQQFKTYKIKLWCFDHQVHEGSYIEIDEQMNYDMNEYELQGFGGTNFGSNWEFMKEKGIKADRLIMLTDGYCGFHGCDENYIKTLWIIHSRYGEFQPPFGAVVKYDEDA